MKIAVLATALLVYACAGSEYTRALTAFTIACDSYETSLKLLKDRLVAGKLSADDARKVERVRVVLTPICLVDKPADPRALLRQVEKGASDLITIKEKSRGS